MICSSKIDRVVIAGLLAYIRCEGWSSLLDYLYNCRGVRPISLLRNRRSFFDAASKIPELVDFFSSVRLDFHVSLSQMHMQPASLYFSNRPWAIALRKKEKTRQMSFEDAMRARCPELINVVTPMEAEETKRQNDIRTKRFESNRHRFGRIATKRRQERKRAKAHIQKMRRRRTNKAHQDEDADRKQDENDDQDAVLEQDAKERGDTSWRN
eukprot:TRINITY_DN3953_c0_g1_i2.p1 TRINITY_DN3953_c0_g1~~TRINITY_DN3953_c0_g1_i2.p1  ORF type:complete len:211 (-),score=53.54 TRINITY_DN3953_c0_g1_i2:30-662(-)